MLPPLHTHPPRVDTHTSLLLRARSQPPEASLLLKRSSTSRSLHLRSEIPTVWPTPAKSCLSAWTRWRSRALSGCDGQAGCLLGREREREPRPSHPRADFENFGELRHQKRGGCGRLWGLWRAAGCAASSSPCCCSVARRSPADTVLANPRSCPGKNYGFSSWTAQLRPGWLLTGLWLRLNIDAPPTLRGRAHRRLGFRWLLCKEASS